MCRSSGIDGYYHSLADGELRELIFVESGQTRDTEHEQHRHNKKDDAVVAHGALYVVALTHVRRLAAQVVSGVAGSLLYLDRAVFVHLLAAFDDDSVALSESAAHCHSVSLIRVDSDVSELCFAIVCYP